MFDRTHKSGISSKPAAVEGGENRTLYARPLASPGGTHCSGGVQRRRRPVSRYGHCCARTADKPDETPLSPVFIPRYIWDGYRDGSVQDSVLTGNRRPVDWKQAASTSAEGRKPAYRPQPSRACVAYDPVPGLLPFYVCAMDGWYVLWVRTGTVVKDRKDGDILNNTIVVLQSLCFLLHARTCVHSRQVHVAEIFLKIYNSLLFTNTFIWETNKIRNITNIN